MNIVKLQDDLKNVPDNALIGYVQNPSGQVPSYLALSELQRRKKMREQAGGAQAQGAQQPSVAEQLVAEATPQPGIAGIPVTNIGNEEAYAAGGIVAFNDGGDVQGYANGGDVEEWLREWEARKAMLSDPERATSWFERNIYSRPQSRYETARTKAGLELLALEKPGIFTKLTPAQQKAYAAREEIAKNLMRGEYDPSIPVQGSTKPAAAPVQSPLYNPEAVRQEAAARIAAQEKAALTAPETPAAPAGRGGPAPLPTASAPAAGFDIEPIKFDDVMYEQMMRKAPTLQEGMKEYMGALGEDPTRAKMAERINQMTEANELYKKQFPWMALAEAGFGMAAGRSPFALQNIAEGGKQGLASFAAGRKETRDQEEKMFNLQAKISEAERAEKKAALDYGFNSKERIEASNERIKLEKIQHKQATNIANKNLEVQQKELEQKERKMQEEAKHNRATEAYYNKTPAEIQVVERMMKDPEFAKKYTELQGVKYRPKADAAKLAAADKSYDNYVKNFRPFKGANGKIVTNPESREVYLRKNFPELVDYTAAGSAEYTYNPKTGKLE